MRVLVAGITGDRQEVRGVESFYALRLHPGDERRTFQGGRGDVNRLRAGDYFEQHPEYGAVLVFDLDMAHPPDAVERLRNHNVDLVSGHYFARDPDPVHSVWCGSGNGRWPFPPVEDPPTSGLHRIGMTGMGCVYISRRAYEAVRDFLPAGSGAFGTGPCPEVTGDHSSLGSDYRFFSVAQLLGFELWGDAGLESKHAATFWIDRNLWQGMRRAQLKHGLRRSTALTALGLREKGMDKDFLAARIKKLEERKADLAEQKAQMERNVTFLDRQIVALTAVISDERWLVEQLRKEQTFPEAPVEELAHMAENRLGLEGVPREAVAEARQNVARKDAMEWIDAADARRPSGDNGR